MEEQLITFETAKLAKEKGFDVKTYKSYRVSTNPNIKTCNALADEYTYFPNVEESISAPTQSLLQKWLREVYNIDVCIMGYENNLYRYSYEFKVYNKFHVLEDFNFNSEEVLTYEEALEKGLQEALTLI